MYDRPGLALANVIAGRPGAAVQSLVSPDSLSPEERKSLADKYGASRFGRIVLSVATNPLVIMGLLMHVRYPVASAKMLMKFKSNVLDYANRAGLVLRNVSSLHTNFANTKIPDLADDLMFSIDKTKAKYMEAVGPAMDKLKAPLQQADLTRIGLWLENAFAKDNWMVERFKLPAPVWTGRLSPEHMEVAQALKKGLEGVFQETVGTESAKQAVLKELMRRKGFAGKMPTTIQGIRQRLIEVGVPVKETGTSATVLARELAERGVISKQLASKLTNQQSMLNAMRGQGFQLPEGIHTLGTIEKLPNYLPHMVRMNAKDFERYVEGVMNATGGDEKLMHRMMTAATRNKQSLSMVSRHKFMLPDPHELEALGPGEFNLGALRKLANQATVEAEGHARRVLKVAPREAPLLGSNASFQDVIQRLKDVTNDKVFKTPFPTYSTLSLPVYERYVHSMAQQHAWTVKGIGKAMMDEVAQLDPLGKAMMQDGYIPQFLGRANFRQSVQAMEWVQSRNRWIEMLKNPSSPLVKYLPKNARE